jgi:hypothetical protein
MRGAAAQGGGRPKGAEEHQQHMLSFHLHICTHLFIPPALTSRAPRPIKLPCRHAAPSLRPTHRLPFFAAMQAAEMAIARDDHSSAARKCFCPPVAAVLQRGAQVQLRSFGVRMHGSGAAAAACS